MGFFVMKLLWYNETMNKQKILYTLDTPLPEDSSLLGKINADNWREIYPNEALGVTKEWVDRVSKRRESSEKNKIRSQEIADSLYPESLHFWKVARLPTGQIIGFIQGRKKDGVQELHGLHILKQYRGYGIGQALLNELLEWFDSSEPVIVDVAAFNDNAIQFYTKNGFKLTGYTYTYEILPMIRLRC